MDFDKRHIGPLLADIGYLAVSAPFASGAKSALVEIGRNVRHNAFEARDTFPAISFRDFIADLGADETPIQMPPVSAAWGNTIGGTVPYYYLGAIAAAVQPMTVFEIGTYLGLSALTFALNTPENAAIHTVDLPADAASDSVATLTRGDRKIVGNAAGKAGRAFIGTPSAAKVNQIWASSLDIDVPAILGGKKLDLGFVDGGHSYELVRNDTEKLLGSLSAGGVMIWDDYRWNLPGVSRYMRELSKTIPLRRIAGSQYIVHYAKWPADPHGCHWVKP
jgi:predicted O-methyltransferase YrrM